MQNPSVEVKCQFHEIRNNWTSLVPRWERDKLSLLTIESDLENWRETSSILCALRASNISALLILKSESLELAFDETIEALGFFRDWDQLLLCNLLILLGKKIPEAYLNLLHQEAKTELRWFREWWLANQDPRVSRYPGLPWRSFIRKVVGENYRFAIEFLEMELAEEEFADKELLIQQKVEAFLMNKKKVICVFPKKWGR